MNPQRDRGIRAERDACKLLTELGGWNVRRRANEGIREDIGDLIGVPDTTIQVSAVPKTPAAIWARARTKTADCAEQQQRHGMTHGVVLLRIDGGVWRALVSRQQLTALRDDDGPIGNFPDVDVTPGTVIHMAPHWAYWWVHAAAGIYVATVDQWVHDLHANLAEAAA